MGKALSDASPVAREVFQEVDDALGQKLFRLMTEGPEDQLVLTENAQPAIMANAIATLRVLEKEGGVTLAAKADYVAGHSLGEYTRSARRAPSTSRPPRACSRRAGRRCRRRCRSASARWRRCSAPISRPRRSSPMRRPKAKSAPSPTTMIPSQVVISGHKGAVERAVALVKDYGIKRGVLLPVSAPFHCPLMQPAADAMAEALGANPPSAPLVPVVANVTASPVSDADTIRDLLVATSHRPRPLARKRRRDGRCRGDAFRRIRRQGAVADGQAQRIGRGRDGQRDFDGRHRSAAEDALSSRFQET